MAGQSELITITPETIPVVCERIRTMLTGRVYRTFDGRYMQRGVHLELVTPADDGLRIIDSEGVLSAYSRHGPASIAFDDLGFTLRYTSLGGRSCVCVYTIETE